jgi:thiol-disulfide isomerase/thioredoxin
MSEPSGEVDRGRGLIFGGAVAMLLLSGVAVWAFVGEGEVQGGGESVATVQAMGGGTAGEGGGGELDAAGAGVVTLGAKQAPSLGELSFEACDPQCRRVPLKELTSTEALLVVNVWATWCEPCLREMALFREVEGWGETIRFVPIELVAARDDQRYEAAVAAMPPTLLRLNDYTSGGIVARALREKEVFKEGQGGGVPQTLILDCEGRARVIYPREILEVEALRGQIAAVAAEMPACAARRQERERAAAAAREVAAKAAAAAAAESVAHQKKNSSVKDAKKCRPRCKAGLRCKEIAGGRFKCV